MDGEFRTPYQYSVEAELEAAVAEAERFRRRCGIGAWGCGACDGRAGDGVCGGAGCGCRLTMRTIERRHDGGDEGEGDLRGSDVCDCGVLCGSCGDAERGRSGSARSSAFHAAEFKRQLAAGVPMAVGSDVGPFPHGTQARELELMVEYGMPPAAVLRADLLNGAKLLGWVGRLGS